MKRKFNYGTILITLFTIIFTIVMYSKLPDNVDSESSKTALFFIGIGIMIVVTLYAQICS